MMVDKTKRKRGPSRWSFPRHFRYEIQGDVQHVAQAIESLQDRFYDHAVQISSDALDDETTFIIYKYAGVQITSILDSNQKRSIEIEAHGTIRFAQPGTVVVEGYALMGEQGCFWVGFIVSILIVGVIFFVMQQVTTIQPCIYAPILGLPILSLVITQFSFENFFKVLSETLQMYTVPPDDETLPLASDLEAPQSHSHL